MRYNFIIRAKRKKWRNPHDLKEENDMKFFIDTANVEDIRKANDMGVI